jgi:hypothetical protein
MRPLFFTRVGQNPVPQHLLKRGDRQLFKKIDTITDRDVSEGIALGSAIII